MPLCKVDIFRFLTFEFALVAILPSSQRFAGSLIVLILASSMRFLPLVWMGSTAAFGSHGPSLARDGTQRNSMEQGWLMKLVLLYGTTKLSGSTVPSHVARMMA